MWIISILACSLGISLSNKFRFGAECKTREVVDNIVNYIFQIPTGVLITLLIIIIYAKIAQIAHQKSRQTVTVYLHSSAHVNKPSSVTTSRSGYKVTKIMAMILGAYLLSIIPQAVVFTITQRLKYKPLHIQIIEKISIWIFMVECDKCSHIWIQI